MPTDLSRQHTRNMPVISSRLDWFASFSTTCMLKTILDFSERSHMTLKCTQDFKTGVTKLWIWDILSHMLMPIRNWPAANETAKCFGSSACQQWHIHFTRHRPSAQILPCLWAFEKQQHSKCCTLEDKMYVLMKQSAHGEETCDSVFTWKINRWNGESNCTKFASWSQLMRTTLKSTPLNQISAAGLSTWRKPCMWTITTPVQINWWWRTRCVGPVCANRKRLLPQLQHTLVPVCGQVQSFWQGL